MHNDYIAAHSCCSNHRKQLLESKVCGCFYCLKSFEPSEIEEWVDKLESEEGQTALCPICGIDAVIGSKSGYPIQVEFLKKMRNHWFSPKDG